MESSQVEGTKLANNAPAGYIGEYIEAIVLIGASVALATGVNSDITNIVLTPGDWDVEGVVHFSPGPTTNITSTTSWVNSVAATLPAAARAGGLSQRTQAGEVPAGAFVQGVPRLRFSVAANTTVFLSAVGAFTLSTLSAFGGLSARRVR